MPVCCALYVVHSSHQLCRCLQVGIYARQMTRQAPDIRGSMFPVEFTIVDRLESPEAAAAAQQAAVDGTPTVEFKKPRAPYTVKILLSVRRPPPPGSRPRLQRC